MYDGYMIKKCLIAFTVSSAIMFGLFWAIPEARAYTTFLDTLETHGVTLDSTDPNAEQYASNIGVWVCNTMDLGMKSTTIYEALYTETGWPSEVVVAFSDAAVDFFCPEYARGFSA